MQQTLSTERVERWLVDLGGDRRVTWIELFFDLIFVAAVAQVSAPLASEYSIPQLVRYTLMFVLIWSAWCGQTYYSTRFKVDDLAQRVAIVAQCFIAAVMAANAKGALDSSDSAGFAAAYGALRFVLVLQYLRMRRIVRAKTLATRYAFGYGGTAAVWIGSALIPAPLRFWFWGIGLALDFLTPFFVLQESRRIPPHSAHLPERFGLFVVIVLGEFVAQVMRGIESQEGWTVSAALTAIGSMGFAFLVASAYFDAAKGDRERHLRSRNAEIRFYLWQYAHLPLCLSIGIAGVGFERAIAVKRAEEWTRFDAAALCLAVVAVMAMLLAIGETSRNVRRTLPGIGLAALQAGAMAGLMGLAFSSAARSQLLVVCTAALLAGATLLVADETAVEQ